MTTKKKATKKSVLSTNEEMEEIISAPKTASRLPKYTPYIIVGLALILFGVFAVTKGWVVSAVVNGKPIFRTQLTQSLVAKYGSQTLEGMISEQLIYDEAKKSGVVITAKDIEEKEAEILKSFGGKVSLEEVLKYQGMTKADFDNQVRIQLFVFRLLGKDVTATDEEVTSFIEKNKEALTATEEGALKEEARTAVMEQKINEKVQPWFTDIKNKAKVFRFNQ